MIIKILGLLTVILTSPSWAQDLIIPTVSATVQEFINTNGTDMSHLTASCETFDACRDMNYHSKTYSFKGNAQSAFEKLVTIGPKQIWKSTSRFEMEYDPESNRFLGKDQELPEVRMGQVFFLELDITMGMQIPVAFEVIELNHNTRTITFSYLKQNKSQGSQRISFHQDGENINIVHETHYKSSSKFRDKYLYGHYHTKLLDVVWDDFGKNL